MMTLPQSAHSHHFVVISGNIGVGKSTLTNQLSKILAWEPFLEAFEDNPYLQDFYDDMKRWSFHSQVYFLSKRLQHHRQLVGYEGNVLQDRSIYEDAEIFAQNLYLQGNMSKQDYDCYRELYDGICAFLPAPSLIVYLKAPVGVLAERIALRGRTYERQISIDYLAQINDLYNQWAEQWTQCPMLVIEADKYDFVQSEDDLNRIAQKIRDALVNDAVLS